MDLAQWAGVALTGLAFVVGPAALIWLFTRQQFSAASPPVARDEADRAL